MRYEGEITSVTDEGDMIGRFTHVPDIGAPVIDKRKKNIGEVTWIFGPTEKPFVEIKSGSDGRKRVSILNEPIYVEEI
ncbi:MAG: Gar1/Naf1 family protein [Candidatus Thermoplasmatota archaeon]